MLTSGFDPDLVPTRVEVDDAAIRVRFSGGLEIATPVARFPRLKNATQEQRKAWRIIGRGDGIHWPDVDEDISVRSLFYSRKAAAGDRMEQVPSLIGELYQTTMRLNHLFQGRPFTPDGHLVGSIGELVAEYIYDLVLEPCSTPQVDAHTRETLQSVQIKLTGQKGTSYGLRWSSVQRNPPDLLLCLKLTSAGFEEVYNGPFPLELLAGKPDQTNGQISLSVKSLSKINPSLLPQKHAFASLNRWFTPQLSDVA